MKFKNILIPTDGTFISNELIDFICSINSLINARINVVYVIEVPRNLPLHTNIPEKVQYAKLALNKAKQIAEKYNVEINALTIYSRTVEDSIISTAEDLNCDAITLAQDNQKLRIFANKASSIYQRAKCSVWLFNYKSQIQK